MENQKVNKKRGPKPNRIEVTEKMKGIMDSNVKTSDKIRSLYTLGMPRMQIVEILKSFESVIWYALRLFPAEPKKVKEPKISTKKVKKSKEEKSTSSLMD